MIYELFVTKLTRSRFFRQRRAGPGSASESFETALADEDVEQEPDRWWCPYPPGGGFWEIISQWLWNLRLELGQHLSATLDAYDRICSGF